METTIVYRKVTVDTKGLFTQSVSIDAIVATHVVAWKDYIDLKGTIQWWIQDLPDGVWREGWLANSKGEGVSIYFDQISLKIA